MAEVNPERVAVKRQQMDQPPYFLDRDRRATVLDAFREVCLHYGWSLWAAHVRTNHVHAVVEADVRPEKIMHAFKSYASRNLRATAAHDGCGRTEMSKRPSDTSSRGKANPWKFTGRSGCSVLLLYSRGSVTLPGSDGDKSPVSRGRYCPSGAKASSTLPGIPPNRE